MKMVKLNSPLRVAGDPYEAGDTVELTDAEYDALRYRKRSGVPLFELDKEATEPDPDPDPDSGEDKKPARRRQAAPKRRATRRSGTAKQAT